MSSLPRVYILDANVLVRLAAPDDPQHLTAQRAVKALRADGAVLRTLPQAIFEFWVVATRPQRNNGLGLSVPNAETLVDYIVRVYWPIPDDPAIVMHWRRLVGQYGTIGKPAHDARYVASMLSHGLSHLVTFDSDFNRYAAEGITVVDPSAIAVS